MSRSRTCAVRALFAALYTMVLSGAAVSQEQPTFRSETVIREIAVSVTDKSGAFVEGLTLEDFEVREAGEIRKIVDLSTWQVQPPPKSHNDVVSQPGQQGITSPLDAARSRSVVILLDDMLTSSRRTFAVREAATSFIREHLSPLDSVSVVTTSGRRDVDIGFTTRHALCVERIRRFMGSSRGTMVGDFSAALAVRRTLEVLASVAANSAPEQGRPLTIVVFSEGIAFDIYDSKNFHTSDVLDVIKRTVNHLETSNVVVYAVDPRGLVTLEEGRAERNTYEEDRAVADSLAGGVAAAMRQQTHQRSLQSLRQLAEVTGGFAAIDRNEFTEAFARIATETGKHYVLAFELRSDGQRLDSSLTVRVKKRGARVAVRSRLPAVRDVDASVPELLSRPVSGGTLPFIGQVLEWGRDRGVVILEIAAEDGKYQREHVRFDVGVAGVSSDGRLRVLQRATLSRGEPNPPAPQGLRWLFEFDKADIAELRLAVVGEAQSGNLVFQLTERSRDGGAAGARDMVVGSLERNAMATAGDAPSLAYLQYHPTVSRTFGRLDVLVVGLTLCGVGAFQGAELRLATSDSAYARKSALEHVGKIQAECSAWAARMPLGGLSAGEYTLEVVLGGSDDAPEWIAMRIR